MSKVLPTRLSTTIGVEMEFNINDRLRQSLWHPEALADLDAPPNWTPKREHTGIEMVMTEPRVMGSALERNVKSLCEWAEATTTGVFDCGVHVHLGIQDALRLPTDRHRILKEHYVSFLAENERAFMYMVPMSRALGYNPPWKLGTIETLRGELGLNRGAVRFPTWLPPTSPRCGLVSFPPTHGNSWGERIWNTRRWFHGISRHGTLENRLLHGTKDPSVVLGWIALLDFVHKKALANELPSTATHSPNHTKAEVYSRFVAALNPPQHIQTWIETQYATHDIDRLRQAAR